MYLNWLTKFSSSHPVPKITVMRASSSELALHRTVHAELWFEIFELQKTGNITYIAR
jgi:hypothetical protein